MATACVVLLERCDNIVSKKDKTILHVKETASKGQLSSCNMATCVVLLEKCDSKLVDSKCDIKTSEKKEKTDYTTRYAGNLYECTCGYAYRKRSLLLKHINSHQEKVPTNDGSTSAESVKLSRHKLETKCFHCRTCSRSFKIRSKLHKNGHVVDNRQYVCWKCDCKFSSERQLTSHACLASVARIKPYRCNFCDATFNYTKNLRHHVITIHEMPQKTSHKCKKCQSKFLCAGDLTLHYGMCHKQDVQLKRGKKSVRTGKLCKCNKANVNEQAKSQDSASVSAVSTASSSTVKEHVTLAPSPLSNKKYASRSAARRYKCLHCDAYFGNVIYYKKHADTHRYLKLTNTQDAEALDTWKKQLEANLNIKTEPRGTVESNVTTSYGPTNSLLDQEDMMHNCASCSARFPNESDLHTHECSHLVTGGYKCADCEAVFKTRQHLMNHSNTHHKLIHFLELQNQVTVNHDDDDPAEVSTLQVETNLNLSMLSSAETQTDTLTDGLNIESSNVRMGHLTKLGTAYLDLTETGIDGINPVHLMEDITQCPDSVVTSGNHVKGNLSPVLLTTGEQAVDSPLKYPGDSPVNLETSDAECTEVVITPDIHFVGSFNHERAASLSCSPEICKLVSSNQFNLSADFALPAGQQQSDRTTSELTQPQVESMNVTTECNSQSSFTMNSAAIPEAVPIVIYNNSTKCQTIYENVAFANCKNGTSKKVVFGCELCGLQCRRKITLNRHIKFYHSRLSNKGGLFKCGQCERQFNSKHLLLQHRRLHHPKPIVTSNTEATLEKLYKCKECKASFTKKCSLERHTRIHTVANQYKCLLCNSAFSNEKYLNGHVSSFHGKKSKLCKKQLPCMSKTFTALQAAQSADQPRLFPTIVEVNCEVQPPGGNDSLLMCSECHLTFPSGYSSYSTDTGPFKCHQCCYGLNQQILGTVLLL